MPDFILTIKDSDMPAMEKALAQYKPGVGGPAEVAEWYLEDMLEKYERHQARYREPQPEPLPPTGRPLPKKRFRFIRKILRKG